MRISTNVGIGLDRPKTMAEILAEVRSAAERGLGVGRRRGSCSTCPSRSPATLAARLSFLGDLHPLSRK